MVSRKDSERPKAAGSGPVSQILRLTGPLRYQDCILPPPPSLEESSDILKLEMAMMALPALGAIEIDEISALPIDRKLEYIQNILKEVNLMPERSQNTNDLPTLAPIKK